MDNKNKIDELKASVANDSISRYASTGYIRSNFYVLSGGMENTPKENNREIRDNIPNNNQKKINPKKNVNDLIKKAKLKGYEGDACGECGNFTLIRNGTCLKCDTCGDLIDVQLPNDDLKKTVKRKFDFKVSDVEITLIGKCNKHN